MLLMRKYPKSSLLRPHFITANQPSSLFQGLAVTDLLHFRRISTRLAGIIPQTHSTRGPEEGPLQQMMYLLLVNVFLSSRGVHKEEKLSLNEKGDVLHCHKQGDVPMKDVLAIAYV